MNTDNSRPWLTNSTAPLPPEIRGLIFDCDGTLLDTMPTHYEAWLAALENTGIQMSPEQFYAMAGVPTPQIAELLCRRFSSPVSARVIAERKERAYQEKIPHIRHVPAVVALARREATRRKIAVASGGYHAVVDHQLAAAGLSGLFPVVICADDVAQSKPAPDTFLEAARRLGLKPSECVVYEDGVPGFQAAHAAGMVCIDVRAWYAD